MPYATLQQLTDRYGTAMLVDLTDRAAVATGEIDESVVARAIADADAVVDGYLAARHVLPLAEVPGLVADLAASVAIWKLHIGTPNDKIAEDYRQAMKTLSEVARGVVRLSVAGTAPADNGASGVVVTDRERPFTAENMKGFI